MISSNSVTALVVREIPKYNQIVVRYSIGELLVRHEVSVDALISSDA